MTTQGPIGNTAQAEMLPNHTLLLSFLRCFQDPRAGRDGAHLLLEAREAETEECEEESGLGYMVSLNKEQQKPKKDCGSQHTRG